MVADVKDQMHRKVRPRFPPQSSAAAVSSDKRELAVLMVARFCIAYFESACHEMIMGSSYILEHRDQLSIAISPRTNVFP